MKNRKMIALTMVLCMAMASIMGCSSSRNTSSSDDSSKDTTATASGDTASGEDNAGTADTSEATDAPASSDSAKTIKIGAMPADSNISFFQELAKGMEQAGKDYGVTVDIQYTKRAIEKELSLTETFISQKYDGLILETVDSDAITGCLQKAKDAGIPMVAVDTVPNKTELAASTVTSDNYAGGKAAGELIKKLLPNGGKVLMTKFKYSSVAMDDRYKGFEDAIKDSNITLVDAVEQDGTREDTINKITPLLTKYSDLAGVFCSQGDPAIGCLSAVNTAGLQSKVKVLSYDIEDEVAAAIASDTALVGGVTQFPYAMGYMSVVQCLKAINGEQTDSVVKIPVLAVTKDNIEEFKNDPTAFLEKNSDFKLLTVEK